MVQSRYRSNSLISYCSLILQHTEQILALNTSTDQNNYPTRKFPIKFSTIVFKQIQGMEAINKYFPAQTRPKYMENSNRKILSIFTNSYVKNASSIPSNLRVGSNRLIALVLNLEQYKQSMEHEYKAPKNTGNLPIKLHLVCNRSRQTKQRRHTNTYSALKKKLQEVLKTIYLYPICGEIIGQKNKYTCDAIEFIYKE